MLEYTPASTLWKTKPPRSKDPEQSSDVYGVMIPADSAASAMIGLNVDPVGYTPAIAPVYGFMTIAEPPVGWRPIPCERWMPSWTAATVARSSRASIVSFSVG